MTDPTEIARVAAGLTRAQRDDLTIHWDEFADADPLSAGRDIDAYLADMEGSDFATWVPVDEDALDDPFAWERGIEPDGMMWELTAKGRSLRDHILREKSGG